MDIKSQGKPDKRCPFTLHCDWSSPEIIQQIPMRTHSERSLDTGMPSPGARTLGPEDELVPSGQQRGADQPEISTRNTAASVAACGHTPPAHKHTSTAGTHGALFLLCPSPHPKIFSRTGCYTLRMPLAHVC